MTDAEQGISVVIASPGPGLDNAYARPCPCGVDRGKLCVSEEGLKIGGVVHANR